MMKCKVSFKDVLIGIFKFILVLAFLYLFLVALDLMGSSFNVIAGAGAGNIFNFVNNPMAGLVVGILVTVLLQSSSTTTSIVVSMVGSGVLEPSKAVFIIFGANIGTSVTNTIVSLGFLTNRKQMRRAFSGATLQDMFNYMNVTFWMPIEWIVSAITANGLGPLGLIAHAISSSFSKCEKNDDDSGCEKWTSPFKTISSSLSSLIIVKNKDAVTDVARGKPSVEMCVGFCLGSDGLGCKGYPFKDKRCANSDSELVFGKCTDGIENAKAVFFYCENSTTANQDVLNEAIEHFNDFKMNIGGFMYDKWGWQEPAGAIVLVFSLIVLLLSLLGLVKVLSSILHGRSEAITKKIFGMPGPLAILFGAGLTMLVQSSSVTTSLLTPLVGIGTIELEEMLPLTLGANIGTTVTGILASLVSDSSDGFMIAMVHVLFNVFGVLLFYPIPFIRAIPLKAACKLGNLAATYKVFPFIYLAFLFAIWPLAILGISIGLSSGETVAITLSALALVGFLALHAAFIYWYKWRGGSSWLLTKFGNSDDPSDDESISAAVDIEKEGEIEKVNQL